MLRLFTTVNHLLDAERPILWLPVPVMLGAGLYFSLAREPVGYVGAAALGLGALLLVGAWKTRWRVLALVLALAALGFASAQWRTARVATPLLAQTLTGRMVEGRIHEIIQTDKGAKLVLEQAQVERLEAPVPVRIRISLRKYDPAWQVGDTVRLRATLYPLPRPAMPDAFDFGRYFYFSSIGAVGFALGQAEVVAHAKESAFTEWLNEIRHGIAQDMQQAMPAPLGAVAAALTMGEQAGVPGAVQDSMRASGLAHVLSISGLHLAIAAGIMFFAVRTALVAVPAVGLRVNAKKIAAGCALLGAFVYLLLAGSPVPAQRSFIMVAFVLAGVLLDRKGISLYALCWAALAIMVLYPESMLGASFQMSFSATLAIVSFYETCGRVAVAGGHPLWRKAAGEVAGIAATSLMATLATAPFAVYHFSRLAVWGLLANMLVVPLSSFVIMPGVVASLLLLPFGLQAPAYWVLEKGVAGMLAISDFFAALPLADTGIYPLTDWGLAVSALGLLLITLLRTRLRLLGVPLMLLGLSTSALHTPPDVLIAGGGKQVMVRLEDGRYTLLKGTMRAFAVQVWLRGQALEEAVPLQESGVPCDARWCEYRNAGRSFLYVKDKNALEAACAQDADVLMVWWYVHAGECAGPKTVIDRSALEGYGAVALWLRAGGIRRESARQTGIRRPWSPPADAGAPQHEEED